MKRSMYNNLYLLVLLLLGAGSAVVLVRSSDARQSFQGKEILIDDFESDEPDGLPTRWRVLHDKKVRRIEPKHMRPDEQFFVVREGRNTFLRAFSEGEAVHVLMENSDEGFDWNIQNHPRLSWDWRANLLPVNAREDDERLNDSGAAVYIIFKMQGLIIKRPQVIKYVYSSTLPIGTVVSYGKLKVIVVSSGLDGTGRWVHVERDVLADYRMVFDDEPPDKPLTLRLWSDSDNTDTPAEADFDNLKFLPAR